MVEVAAEIGPGTTANDCWACGAGRWVASPAWLPSITQVPTPRNDTVEPEVEPESEQTVLAEASMVSATGRPEEAVAVTL